MKGRRQKDGLEGGGGGGGQDLATRLANVKRRLDREAQIFSDEENGIFDLKVTYHARHCFLAPITVSQHHSITAA